MRLTRFLRDEAATLALGAQLAPCLEKGVVVHLHGDLGAGKTTLVRGCLRGLGFRGKVKSPSYTLLELYALSKLDLYHFDFYRFKTPSEWAASGFREYFDSGNVCLVEWPEKVGGLLPPPDLNVWLRMDGEGRTIDIEAKTPRGVRCLARLDSSAA